MLLRTLLAPALAATNALVRAVLPSPTSAVRILVLHDVPATAHMALVRLIDHLAAGPGFVTPAEARERLCGRRGPDGRTPVLLSFDDGFASNLAVAHDILEPRGIRALFFVCPGLIDTPPAKRREAIARHVFRGQRGENTLPAELDLMNWPELAVLAEAGHEVGCHSLSHDRLSGRDDVELEVQIGNAKQRLVAAMGRTTDWFAFPFGDIDSIDDRALAAIGRHFPLCRSGIRGLAHAGSHPLALPAESVDLDASQTWIDLGAKGGLDPLYRRRLKALQTMAERILS